MSFDLRFPSSGIDIEDEDIVQIGLSCPFPEVFQSIIRQDHPSVDQDDPIRQPLRFTHDMSGKEDAFPLALTIRMKETMFREVRISNPEVGSSKIMTGGS